MARIRYKGDSLYIDYPRAKEPVDNPWLQVLADVDPSKDVSAADLRKVQMAQVMVDRVDVVAKAQASARSRALETVDLLGFNMVKGVDNYINEVPDELWEQCKKVPIVQTHLATGTLEELR